MKKPWVWCVILVSIWLFIDFAFDGLAFSGYRLNYAASILISTLLLIATGLAFKIPSRLARIGALVFLIPFALLGGITSCGKIVTMVLSPEILLNDTYSGEKKTEDRQVGGQNFAIYLLNGGATTDYYVKVYLERNISNLLLRQEFVCEAESATEVIIERFHPDSVRCKFPNFYEQNVEVYVKKKLARVNRNVFSF